uniref:Ig-like domain-containing protein n=1 Tax=Poecilia reticulata TaxID=8081 RepID=A0A3P9Q083_POERE
CISFRFYLPRIKLSPREVTVGDSIEMECHMTGSTPIKVTWSKDHKDIRSGGNYKISCVENTAHLTILKADKGDTGKYFCHASNDMGKDSCSTDISVKGILHIEDMEGKLVKIEGRVSGSQPVSVSWFKDGKEIHSSDKYDISFKSNVAVLCIKSSQVTDSGRYSCQASNEAGRASCDVTVGILGGSAPTKKLDNLFFIEEPKSVHVTESKTLKVEKRNL